MWVVRLLGIGALVLAVLVGLNLVSPAVDPCPADSPTIPPPGPLGMALDVFLDQCVNVAGDVDIARCRPTGGGGGPGRIRAVAEGPWTGLCPRAGFR